jgi:uncharacterized BrkB/YihY/UPF0761 family membrane protein
MTIQKSFHGTGMASGIVSFFSIFAAFLFVVFGLVFPLLFYLPLLACLYSFHDVPSVDLGGWALHLVLVAQVDMGYERQKCPR